MEAIMTSKKVTFSSNEPTEFSIFALGVCSLLSQISVVTFFNCLPSKTSFSSISKIYKVRNFHNSNYLPIIA
jgi:hypothetical protein